MFKQLHYFKSWLLLMLCMVVGVGSASADTVTFTAGTDTSEGTSITKDGITVSFSSGVFNRTDNYRCYSGASMTISSTVGNITQIDFTATNSNPMTNFSGNPNVGAWTDASTKTQWKGDAAEINFGTTSGQARITEIVVTYTSASSSPLASISVDGAETIFHVGDEFTHAQAVVTATYEDESTAEVTVDATFSEPDMTTVGEKEVEVSYTEGEVTKTDTYTINVLAPATLDRIELSGSYPTEFTQGDEFSHEGLMVTAWYDDDTSEDVTADATFSEPDMTTAGEQTVTVTYEGKTEEYTITVNEYVQPTEVTVNMNYQWLGSGNGSNLSSNQLPVVKNQDNVTITITDGTSTRPRGDADYIRVYKGSTIKFEAPTGYNIKEIVFTTGGNNTWNAPIVDEVAIDNKTWIGEAAEVTFSLDNGNCFIASAAITLEAITPKVLSSITLSGEYPTIFHTGDAFSHEGMTVTANYDDETTKDVTANATFSGYNMDTAGQQTVTVSYSEGEATETATYTINVNAPATLESITLSGEYLTEFEQGDAFSSEGIVVTANWSDQTTTTVTSDATFTGYDMSTLGEQTVTVTYAEKTATYTINVVEKKGTETNPYTVAEALAATPASGTSDNVYIEGIVTSFQGDDIISDSYHRYYISDDGTQTDELLVFGGKGLNNVAFSSADDLKIGDHIVIYGKLTTYSGTKEVAGDNYIVSLDRPGQAELSFGEESYEVAIGGALTITATSTNSDGAITYESSNEEVATIDYETGEVTALQAGTTTITATIANTTEFSSNYATVELTVIDPRTPVELSFTGVPETININETETYTATATPFVEQITYESSDDNIVMVDENTGVILALAAGTATITATFPGDSENMPASASYTIKVVDPNAPTETWVLVDPTDLQTGDIVVIVDQTTANAMGNTNGASSAPTVPTVTLKEDKSEITSAVDATIQWVVTIDEDETRTYQFGVQGTDNYLYCTNTNNGVRVGTNSNNVFTLKAHTNNVLFLQNEATSRYVGHNTRDGNNDWRCYTSVNANINACVTAFYKKVATVPVTITSAGAASFSCDKALDFSQVEGITAYKATAVNETTVHLDEVEQVPAGAGVIVKGAEGTYQIPVATGDVAELTGNLLVGTVNSTFTVEAADYGKVFKYVKRTSDNVVGFQKATEGWTCQAGHAYLYFPETQAREFIGIFGEDISTGIEAIDNSQLTIDNDAPAYNLAGQKVGKGYKGIVVKNGKKVVK